MLDSYSGRRAVVIGAGISGLAAARALAEHFEHVVVLERDELPADATPRPGVPQGRHPHGLPSGGLNALCKLFPDFSTTLVEAGAHVGDYGLHVQCEFPGQEPLPRRALDVPVYIMTRPALELAIRRRVMKRENVSFRGGCRVVDLVSAPDGKSVAGVSCEMRGAKRETVLADLVVDASGRAAPTMDFLKSTGRPAPEETTIGVDLGYSSAVYSIAEEALPDFMAVMTMPAAPERSRDAGT